MLGGGLRSSRLAALLLLVATCAPGLPAAAQDEEARPARPSTIHIGLYPTRVDDLDLKAGTVVVTFYVWTRWRGDIDGTAYEIVNGTIDSKEHEFRATEGAVHYAYYRMRATVAVDFDFRSFPLDEHELRIEIEHSDEDESVVRFALDRDGVRHVPSPQISGWNTGAPRYSVVTTTYRTNWGYPGVAADDVTRFSQFRTSIDLRHDVAATFLKTFLPVFISVLIAFIAFFVDPEELEARVGVGVAGVFGAVTSQAVVSDTLPEIPYLTLSDQVHYAGLFFIFLALLETCVAGYLVRREKHAKAVQIDRYSRYGVPLVYAAVVVVMILAR